MKKTLFFIASFCVVMILLFESCENGQNGPDAPLTMDNGYQYYHYTQNEGPKPKVGEVAYYYFTMYADDSLMLNGREAEMVSKTMIPKPIPNQDVVVSPTVEGIKLMSIGDSMRVIVPFDSIPELPPGYDKYENIYYDLVLIDIKSGEENSKIDFEERQKYNAILMETDSIAKLVLEDYRAGKLDDQIIEKPSGLKIYIHEQGSGPKPQKGETVYLRYHGSIVDGTLFDSSFNGKHLYTVKVGSGSVVDGWDEGLEYLNRGTKATLFVPSDLGYGDEGYMPAIPPKAELAYYIELVK